MTRVATHDGAAVKARNGKQNENRARFQPNRLGHPVQSIRSPGAEFYRAPCGFKPVVLTIQHLYLSAQDGCRNEAAAIILGRSEPWNMSTFDKREEGFEKKFAHDEELKFKAEARRNKLLGLWAAGQLGLSGEAAVDYARTVVAADFEEAGDGDVVRKVMRDLETKGIAITEPELRAKMNELMAEAIAQLKAGM
jgi:hypothetical protein